MEKISCGAAFEQYGVSTNHERMDNGELRFRLIGRIKAAISAVKMRPESLFGKAAIHMPPYRSWYWYKAARSCMLNTAAAGLYSNCCGLVCMLSQRRKCRIINA